MLCKVMQNVMQKVVLLPYNLLQQILDICVLLNTYHLLKTLWIENLPLCQLNQLGKIETVSFCNIQQ